MTIYNLMTMENFGSGFQPTWIGCWLALVIVVYLGFILRRQCADGFLAGTNYNVIGALVVGLALAVLLATFTGNPIWALLGGIGGLALGGFVVGMFFPSEYEGSEGGSDDYGGE